MQRHSGDTSIHACIEKLTFTVNLEFGGGGTTPILACMHAHDLRALQKVRHNRTALVVGKIPQL
jgi:hypothetical protein